MGKRVSEEPISATDALFQGQQSPSPITQPIAHGNLDPSSDSTSDKRDATSMFDAFPCVFQNVRVIPWVQMLTLSFVELLHRQMPR